jgi:alpha-1,6-mannosyltransferase
MKIVDVAEFYSEHGGGVRTYIQQKFAAAAAAGHELVVIAPGHESREEPCGAGRILWVKGPREWFDARYGRFDSEDTIHRLLDREQPDIVEASSPWRAGRAVASWAGACPRVLVLHNDPVAVYGHSLLDRWVSPERIDRLAAPAWRALADLSGGFEATIAAGAWLARRFTRFGIVRCEAIPFGIDKALFSPRLRRADLRAAMLRACGRDPDDVLFMTVARHHPEKRIGTILDAIAQVGRKRRIGLFLVGDGPLRAWVARRAAGVGGVHIAGRVERPQLAQCLASADVLLHAGAAETFGLAVAEGFCAGLPAVLPDRGGAAELAHPSCSELYTPGDARACAAAMERLLARDRAALQAAAVRRAGDIRTWQQHFTALFERYAALAGNRGLQAAA